MISDCQQPIVLPSGWHPRKSDGELTGYVWKQCIPDNFEFKRGEEVRFVHDLLLRPAS
eukprot:gene31320-5344_t